MIERQRFSGRKEGNEKIRLYVYYSTEEERAREQNWAYNKINIDLTLETPNFAPNLN